MNSVGQVGENGHGSPLVDTVKGRGLRGVAPSIRRCQEADAPPRTKVRGRYDGAFDAPTHRGAPSRDV